MVAQGMLRAWALVQKAEMLVDVVVGQKIRSAAVQNIQLVTAS
jgi:hypothetical protein